MKQKLIALVTVALLTIMLASMSSALACKPPTNPPPPPQPPQEFSPLLETRAQGVIWYFSTDADGDGVSDFNGNNIKLNTVVATWYGEDANGNFIGPITIKPLLILTTKDYVMLVFLPRSLPGSSITVEGNAVEGYLKNGDHFVASGPGWTYGHT